MNRLNIIRAYDSRNAQADLLTQGLQASGEQVKVFNLELQSVKMMIKEIDLPTDVIHYHNASLVAPQFSDVYVEMSSPSAVFIQYNTSDLRTRTEAIRLNPYANLIDYQDETITNRLQRLSQRFPACIVNDYEAAGYAAKYHSRVYIVPYALDLKSISLLPTPQTRSDIPLKIIHPCANNTKGTEFVELILNRLQNEGYCFDYEKVENFSHTDTLKKMQQADIIIDQLLHGSYGIVSIEAMALRKPVISHIRNDLIYKYNPAPPVISANPATLYHKLIPLLEDSGIRESIGEAGRKFVDAHHAIDTVINKLLWAYQNELKYRQNSSLSDQKAIFDLISGKLVGMEGYIKMFYTGGGISNNPSYNSPNYNSPSYNSPNKQNERTNIGLTFNTGRSSDKQHEQTIPPATPTVSPTKSVHISSKQISKKPVGQNLFCSIKVRYLSSTRYFVKKRKKNRTFTYFSFDLSKLPKSAIITKADIILPIMLKKKQKVSIVQVNRKLSQKRTKGKPLIILPKRIELLSIKSVSTISKWRCTELVKYWHRNHLKNNGVLISNRLWKKPKLVVHFHKKC
jgi:hypothetical protein